MNALALIQGLRFVDSFFPSGGFAYSSGLEAAVQGGAVRNAEDFSRYVEDLLLNGMGRREAVAVARAWDAQARGSWREAIAADWELDSMKIGRESRQASRQMGRQVIRIAAEQIEGCSLLQDFLAAVEAERTPCHLAVSLGLTLAAAGWMDAADCGVERANAAGYDDDVLVAHSRHLCHAAQPSGVPALPVVKSI
jgi:urease accessory protein